MELTRCPVCSSKDFRQVLQVKDQLVSRETFDICECRHCSLRFTNPRPDDPELASYYQSEDYISHTNEGNSLVNRLYKLARVFTLRSKRKLIQKETAGKKLLDIGCGTGHFLEHCSIKGWKAFGVEPDTGARKVATEQHKLQVVEDLDKVEASDFDRITLWHVLEHLPELHDSLKKISALLKADGKLFIAVPNYLAYEEHKFKANWAAYDVPRHLYHFSPKSLKTLTLQHGLKVDKVYPMWLDSFYISLLSNQQKYNSNRYLNSFIIGSLSNIYGIKTGSFSSLIYQLSKSR
jgi:2-polyprenyl-3-methyl-5-hydroxy-6-metoxy-1,4-benzoquinol methylase